uniref:TonB-dependent receptor n=1 Tax=Roseihalotalea indica TaxID=2867963 RepID=A0AA49GP36_9BACT|nr:TonB-dependent receptor [Tunicatimonas sp. TK19036]
MRINSLLLWNMLLLGLVFGSSLSAYCQSSLAALPSERLARLSTESPVVKQVKEKSLRTVLEALEEKYGVFLSYDLKAVEHKTIEVKLEKALETDNSPVEEVLATFLKPVKLDFLKVKDRYYVIYPVEDKRQTPRLNHPSSSLVPPFATNQPPRVTFRKITLEKTITGQVLDMETDDPLPGVNVVVKGTTTGTVTDVDGNYRLTVADNAETLVFSSVGFTSEEVAIGNQTVINVTLAPDIQALSEVVVVGYGTQKKADITGAIATMEAKSIEERPLARVDQALVGQMAGVRVQQTSGVPGKGFRVQVRGTGSINANNEPLYVIDGFPLEAAGQNSSGGFSNGNPLDNINPNDIASIQVLKDASAAAIYGSRASNGVVIITTKSGQSGQARISFNAYTGFQEPTKHLDILTADEWVDRAIEMINYNWVNSGDGRTADQTSAEREAILGGFDRNVMIDDRWLQPGHPGLTYLDWQDEFFRRGVLQNYALSATGGNEFVKYYVSGDFLDQEGVAVGVNYRRYSARANVEVQASDKVKFGLNISPTYSIINDPGVEGKDQLTHITVGMVPVVEDSVGIMTGVAPYDIYTWGNSRVSPVATAQASIGENRTFRTLSTAYVQYDVLDGLALKTSFNLDNNDTQLKGYTPGRVSRNRNTTGSFDGYRRLTFVNENTISFDRTIAERHQLSAVAGISYSYNKLNSWDISGTFPSEGVTTLNAATIQPNSTSSFETQSVLLSYFGRVQYSFNDRYLLTASIRRDGSSRFGQDTKWGIFPSASAGWRISEENFMRNIAAVSDLKLRASWGLAGNNGIGDYSHIALLDIANYSFGGALGSGLVPQNYANPDLSWEQSETVDIGFDLGLLANRIYTSFDYYTKRNTDLLLNIPVPSATGFTTALTNIGEVLNKGWEVELTTRNLTGPLEWTTNLNFSHNTNEVVQLGPENTPILGGDFDINHNILKVGEPMYSFYVVQQIGILFQEDIDNGAALYGSEEAGDPKYLDANEDGVIDPDDRVLSGHPNPDYVWGVSNTLNYKGFDLSVLVQGQWGSKLYSTFGRAMNRTGMGFVDNALGRWAERWRSPEEPGNSEVPKTNSNFGRIKNTDWLYDASYVRVRNITLGYNLGNLINSDFISAARVYVTAENYFGHDNYTGGFNPEAVNTSGDDYGAFPLPKSVIFGVNLTF